MNWSTARGYGWARALRLLGDRPGVAVGAIVCAALALAASLFTLAVAQMLVPHAKRIPPAEATAFVAPGTTAAELKALAARVESTPGVAAVRLITREAALAELQKRTGPALAELKSNPLPDVLVAEFAVGTAPADVEAAVASIRKQPKVESVVAELDWYRKFAALTRAAASIAVPIGAAMALLVIAIVLAAVRLLAATSEAELRVLELVGADASFVRRPFVYAGAMVLALASALSIGLLALAYWAINPTLAELGRAYGADLALPWPAWPGILAYLAGAILVGGAVAAAGLGRPVRGAA
jgi:cell division transport system permease protein